MKTNKIIVLQVVYCLGIVICAYGQEQDYNRLFRTFKGFTGPVDILKVDAKPIESNAEIDKTIENGMNSLSLLVPYAKGKMNLPSIIKQLSTYHFNLRSPRSTEVYKKAVYSTVLVVAPDIGSGAGFVIDKAKGLVVTNYHVTSGLKNLLVGFYDENIQDLSKIKLLVAAVIRYSAIKDIAILKLSSVPKNLHQLYFEEGSKPAVGESVHTIGHPLSLTWTYSSGLITALRNKFKFGNEEMADVIQIDANISPGNSGGPLLNENANLVGMVTFSSGNLNAQNLNFALSSKELKAVLNSRRNEDTQVSIGLQKLPGLKLISLNDIRKSCKAYNIDMNKDGKIDYLSFREPKTGKEVCSLAQKVEFEDESGNKQIVNLLSMDINDDEVLDTVMVDNNLDNKFEYILIDINQDGSPDLIGVDSNGKGIITQAWIL